MGVDPRVGLSSADAAQRLLKFGPNALPDAKRRSLLGVFFDQFKSPLIYLLFGASALALVLGHASDAMVIAAVVLINALVGAIQEGRAERSLLALREMAGQQARIVRDGREQVIAAREVCPGDLLALEAGQAVVADGRLVEAVALRVSEAALTGESVPVGKGTERLPPDTVIADRTNMIYSGTHITAGRGLAIVVATGAHTEMGRIAELAENATEPKTPLEQRIAHFGRAIIYAAVLLFLLLLGIGLWRNIPFGQLVMVAISQTVGMIPEGLPVAMTVALAVGVQRMSAKKAIVRRLAAVETLGSTTVICTDKTGTLTRNEMTVTKVWLTDGTWYSVTGTGYAPDGAILREDGNVYTDVDADLRLLLTSAVLCNDAQLNRSGADRCAPIGDPTEIALLTLAYKGGVDAVTTRAQYPRTAEIPFDPAEKVMATWHPAFQQGRIVVKGAPEVLVGLAGFVQRDGRSVPLDPSAASALHNAADLMGGDALRVLAVGIADMAQCPLPTGTGDLRGKITLIGLVGQIDPPRDEVPEAVARCQAAGIRPVMVTGDHKVTGQSIATRLGICKPGDAIIDGVELTQLSDTELAEKLDTVSVFTRVHPAQKLRIVDAYQTKGHVAAMTGDGVNDAPALAKADVGIAMGITGTDVAKESAKIVIADDNFATIVDAVEEGRAVYHNIQKVVLYLFSTSMAEVAILFIALLLGYPPPLAAVQILWINLVTEGTLTINLVMEPGEKDEMQKPPIVRNESLFTRMMWSRILLMMPTLTAATLGWFLFRLHAGIPFAQVQTEAFTVLAVCEWFNVLNCRSEYRSVFRSGLFTNRWLIFGLIVSNLLQLAVVFVPWLNAVFHTVPFGIQEFLLIGVVASSVLWVEEIRKWWVRKRLGLTPS